MKIKILILLLFVTSISYAQISTNMVVLKPIVITPLITGGPFSSSTLYAYYNVTTSTSTAWGTNNFNNCHGGGTTLNFVYSSSTGGSYTGQGFPLSGGGTATISSGTLSPTGGTISFSISGNMVAESTYGFHTYLTTITLFGTTFSINQSGGAVSTWANLNNCP